MRLHKYNLPAFRGARFCWSAMVCAALLLVQSRAWSAADELDELKSAFTQLQQENAELRKKLETQALAIDQLMSRLEALEQKPPAAPSNEGTMPGMTMPREAYASGPPRATLQWFGDVDYNAGGEVRNNETQPPTFSLGQLGLMVNSALTQNMSVLSEIVFQYNENQAASTTVERLQLQYNVNDLFNFRLGRTHTPFGYWNETYHHGTWFQTTSLRPEILRFHDGGSVLPIHSVGLEMYGYQPFSALDFQYNVGVANGRAANYNDTQNNHDPNSNKAVYGVISLGPAAVPGLRFGINGYWDKIPPAPPSRVDTLNESIWGAHVVYLRDRLELLSEATHIDHRDPVTSRLYTTTGMYAQLAYQFGRFTPYYRYDRLNVGEGDPYYGPLIVDVTRHTVGLRWDLIDWAALKFEYQHIDQANLSSPSAFLTQGTFTF
jgi:hypothetical protein